MLNIICLDNNYLFLTTLAVLLKNKGFNPILATNPTTVLLEMSLAKRKLTPIHALITDFHAPGFHTADEFCKKIITEFPETFIAVLTGDTSITPHDFGSVKPDILLNKREDYQAPLLSSLEQLKRKLSGDINSC